MATNAVHDYAVHFTVLYTSLTSLTVYHSKCLRSCMRLVIALTAVLEARMVSPL